MKNWILTHKLLTVILACVIGAGGGMRRRFADYAQTRT